MMKNLAKEPLLHFLVLGALLFALYGWLNQESVIKPNAVRITEAEVDWLTEAWSRQWQRSPTKEEQRGLIKDYLKERLLAEEAIQFGLDQNDMIVRRRLAQKMEFIVKDTARLSEPPEQDLKSIYESKPEKFTTASRVTFKQIFFNAEKRKDAASDAEALLAQITRTNIIPENVGDASLLEREFRGIEENSLSSLFGEGFAEKVMAAEEGRWTGPVESSYGQHLIFIESRNIGTLRPFSEVMDHIRAEWFEKYGREMNEKYFNELFEKYDVIIDENIQWLFDPIKSANEKVV